MADYIPDIETLIPQGRPFLLVDRLVDAGDLHATTSFLVTPDHLLTLGGKISMAGLIENMAQTAAAGAGYAARTAGGEMRRGAIVGIRKFEIAWLPDVGDELLTEVKITDRVADIVVISGRITCRQSVVATGEMKILTGV